METYGVFRQRRTFPEGEMIVELLRYRSFKKAPRDDTFDLDNAYLYAVVDTDRFHELMEQVRPEHNIPEHLKQIRKGSHEQLTLFP